MRPKVILYQTGPGPTRGGVIWENWQPQSNLHCKLYACLMPTDFHSYPLSLVLTAPTQAGMARLSWLGRPAKDVPDCRMATQLSCELDIASRV